MEYALYESMEWDCNHEIILENPSHKYIIGMWCEDCLRNHRFGLVDHFFAIEDVWQFVQKEMED